MKNALNKSAYGSMYYIIKNNICYTSLRRRGLENTFTEVCNFNAKHSKKQISSIITCSIIDMLIAEDENLLNYFLLTYFSSVEFERDKYFAYKFNPKIKGHLEILADILCCIDHNDGGVISEIRGDADGVTTSVIVFEKSKGLSRLLSGSDKGKLSATFPLSNVNAIIAENTSVAFRMNDGKIYICGNQSTVTEENFDIIYASNIVDFNN